MPWQASDSPVRRGSRGYSPVIVEGRPKQKEWYGRAWLIAAASAADFSYRIVADDEVGVDMTVHRDNHTLASS